jgi:hypothetical protein
MPASKARGSIWYVLIAPAIVIVVYLYLFFVSETYGKIVDRWLSLLLETAVVFSLETKWFWAQRGRVKFWLVLCLLCLTHLSGFFYITETFGPIPGKWAMIIFPFEAGGLWVLISAFLNLPLNRLDGSL